MSDDKPVIGRIAFGAALDPAKWPADEIRSQTIEVPLAQDLVAELNRLRRENETLQSRLEACEKERDFYHKAAHDNERERDAALLRLEGCEKTLSALGAWRSEWAGMGSSRAWEQFDAIFPERRLSGVVQFPPDTPSVTVNLADPPPDFDLGEVTIEGCAVETQKPICAAATKSQLAGEPVSCHLESGHAGRHHGITESEMSELEWK